MSTPAPDAARPVPSAYDAMRTQDPTTDQTLASAGPSSGGLPFLSPPQSPDEIGRLGDYRVLAKLGEGGMGFVFRGEDPALRRPVALKVMRPEVAAKPQAAERFLREGRAAAGLKSDHIIIVYQVGQANGVPFMAMEFLEGLPLDEWLKRQTGPVPLAHALRIARDTLRGLATAHDKGLIHRDIKPANLWLEAGTSRVKVLDFGLTRAAGGDEQLTAEGAVVGTPAYMAPEQAAGNAVDPRADLFSVGAVLHHLLTGKNPFRRDGMMATLMAVSTEAHPPLTGVRPDVPTAYADFVDRLLSKAPAGRPAHAKAALTELSAIEKSLRETATVVVSASAYAAPAPTPAWDALIDDTADAAPAAKPKAAKPKKPPSKALLAGSLFAFVVLLSGLIIYITNKDGSKTKIELPDEAKVEVKDGNRTIITAGGKKADPKAPVVMDADRAAAEWVLADGGTVRVGGTFITAAADLPPGPFKVAAVRSGRTPVTDADLDRFRDLTDVNGYELAGPVTDAGLKKFAGFAGAPRVTILGVRASRVTDAGLAELARLPQLTTVRVQNAKGVRGPGLAHFKGSKVVSLDLTGTGLTDDGLAALKAAGLDLQYLSIIATTVTDAGLAHVGGLTLTGQLQMQATPNVTDAGFRHLEALTRLTHFEYSAAGQKLTPASLAAVGKMTGLTKLAASFEAPVTDADLTPLLGLPKLAALDLMGRAIHVTDAGLAALGRLPMLKSLRLQTATKLTAAGVAAFRKARPDVDLASPFDADADRKAAEFVFARGGTVDVAGVGGVPDSAKLPAGPFKITGVWADAPAGPMTDADLAVFRDLTSLEHLAIRGPVTDAGVAALADRPWAATLKTLVVHSPALTDAAFAAVPKFRSLSRLALDESPKVTGAGLVHLKGSTVEALHLNRATLADAELARLKDLPKLTTLDLTQTNVTDASLKGVGDLRALKFLSLYGARAVSDAGAKYLENLTNLEELHANAVPFGDAGLATLAKLPKLKVLTASDMVKVTDAGLGAFATVPGLQRLNVRYTALTDTGLTAFAGCKTLKSLDVTKTNVTAAGVAAFRKARPGVDLTSDFPK